MTEKKLNDWSRKELMALPTRDWKTDSVYDSVLVLSTRLKHDSGWAMIAVIGVNKGQPVEIASACSDDVEWVTMDADPRMDCAFRSGAMHFWSSSRKFKVGLAISSIRIELI